MFKAAIFDMDGTILNTLEDLADSVNHALQACGYPKRSLAEVRSFLGSGMNVLVHLSVPEGTSAEDEAKVLALHRDYYPLHCAEQTRSYDGVTDLLKKLRAAGLRTAVVSNKADANVQALVRDYFDGLFDVAIGAQQGMERKPAPDMVEEALRRLQVSGQEAVYIGDSDVDVSTAKNAGLSMVTVLWGFRDRDMLEKVGADNFAENTDTVYRLLCGSESIG